MSYGLKIVNITTILRLQENCVPYMIPVLDRKKNRCSKKNLNIIKVLLFYSILHEKFKDLPILCIFIGKKRSWIHVVEKNVNSQLLTDAFSWYNKAKFVIIMCKMIKLWRKLFFVYTVCKARGCTLIILEMTEHILCFVMK